MKIYRKNREAGKTGFRRDMDAFNIQQFMYNITYVSNFQNDLSSKFLKCVIIIRVYVFYIGILNIQRYIIFIFLFYRLVYIIYIYIPIYINDKRTYIDVFLDVVQSILIPVLLNKFSTSEKCFSVLFLFSYHGKNTSIRYKYIQVSELIYIYIYVCQYRNLCLKNIHFYFSFTTIGLGNIMVRDNEKWERHLNLYIHIYEYICTKYTDRKKSFQCYTDLWLLLEN